MDALGNPVHFLLTGGNIFDASVAVDLLSEVKISGSNILGDKAYGTNSIRTYITEQRASYSQPLQRRQGRSRQAAHNPLPWTAAHKSHLADCRRYGCAHSIGYPRPPRDKHHNEHLQPQPVNCRTGSRRQYGATTCKASINFALVRQMLGST